MILPILGTLAGYANISCSVQTWRYGSPECFGMNETLVLENIYKDPTWHKAIFYRDPIVRFESAFTSKCVPGHDPLRLSVKHCQRAFAGWNITIEQAMHHFNQTKKMDDIHFIPQSNYCGNLNKYAKYFDSKMNLDAVEREEVFNLFENRGINASIAPKVFTLLNKAFPDNQTAPVAHESSHITHAAYHAKELYRVKMYREQLLAYYKDDIENFNISLPDYV
jgi:hypothetical protein